MKRASGSLVRCWPGLAALALACWPALASGRLTLPLVDLSTHLTNTAASIAVWSGTDISLTAGTTLVIGFPSDWTLPALNVASCGCIFLKHTLTSTAGAFTPYEVTVTAGTLSGQNLTVTLPVSLGPGPFYTRIDTYAAFLNPPTVGIATFTLTAGSNMSASHQVVVGGSVEVAPSEIKGVVCLAVNPCLPLKGGVVVASTDSSFMSQAPLLELGPSSGTITAMATTEERLMTTTGSDGGFSMKVPFHGTTTYYVEAFYGTSSTAGASVNLKSAISTLSISSPTAQSVTLTTFVNTSSN